MNIGFDAKRAAQNRTGLGNYSRYVIRLLAQQAPDNQYHLYIPNPRRTPLLAQIPALGRLCLHYPQSPLWRALSSLWRVWGITPSLARHGIHIFHGLSNELPLNIRQAPCRSIVTIHDLIFLSHPQYYHPIDRHIYNYKFGRACRQAHRVIAVSHYTKQQIVERYAIDPRKIDVVYQGCDPAFARPLPPEQLADVSRRHRLPPRFLLYVGTIEERKNLMLVAKALGVMRERGQTAGLDVHVVAVGRRTPYADRVADELRATGLQPHFHFRHDVPFADLPAFYRLATAFVYPSRVEGFGIPMLEAITSGLPAIACTGSCLEEAGGPASIYVAPDDSLQMADAIARVWTDPHLRQQMAREGIAYAQNFTDQKIAQQLINVYKKVETLGEGE